MEFDPQARPPKSPARRQLQSFASAEEWQGIVYPSNAIVLVLVHDLPRDFFDMVIAAMECIL